MAFELKTSADAVTTALSESAATAAGTPSTFKPLLVDSTVVFFPIVCYYTTDSGDSKPKIKIAVLPNTPDVATEIKNVCKSLRENKVPNFNKILPLTLRQFNFFNLIGTQADLQGHAHTHNCEMFAELATTHTANRNKQGLDLLKSWVNVCAPKSSNTYKPRVFKITKVDTFEDFRGKHPSCYTWVEI